MEQEKMPGLVADQLPMEYRPLTAWKYFWLKVLYAIPVLGFIFLIIHTFSRSNYNRRAFARSYWIEFFVGIIVTIILAAICIAAGISLDQLAM